ncbi:Utr2p [Pseudohyphozyma bogoriensis]|nr:Utr2p [Pseudohyphozyma bogoriensis]
MQLTFSSSTPIIAYDSYNNDATAANWTLDSGNAFVNDSNLVLTLTKSNGGTRVSTTRAIWYGNVTARMRTGKWAGVVTAFITMSGVKDEIDWEFVGNQTTTGQTNYYFEGYTANYTHGGTATYSDSYENWHDYGFVWTPDSLEWTVDGAVVRTLLKNNTLDQASGVYEFPQSPSRIQLGLWASGEKGENEGTIEWGGGLVDWKSPDYTENGYYSALVESVAISCYPTNTSGVSYVYGTNVSNVPYVAISQDSTKIYSQLATGLNMSAGETNATETNSTYGIIVGSSSSDTSAPSVVGLWRLSLLLLVGAGALM